MRCYICDADSVTVVWNDELKKFDPCEECLTIARDAAGIDKESDSEWDWDIEDDDLFDFGYDQYDFVVEK